MAGIMNSKTYFFLGCFLQVNKGMYDSAKTLASKDQAKGFPVARPVSNRGKEGRMEGVFSAVLFCRIVFRAFHLLSTAVDFLKLLR